MLTACSTSGFEIKDEVLYKWNPLLLLLLNTVLLKVETCLSLSRFCMTSDAEFFSGFLPLMSNLNPNLCVFRPDRRSDDGVSGEAEGAARGLDAPRAGGAARHRQQGRGRGERRSECLPKITTFISETPHIHHSTKL